MSVTIIFLVKRKKKLPPTMPIDIEQSRYLFVALDFHTDTNIVHGIACCVNVKVSRKNHLLDICDNKSECGEREIGRKHKKIIAK